MSHECRTISRSKTAGLLQQTVTGAAVVTVDGAAVVTVDFESARFETQIAATAGATVGCLHYLFEGVPGGAVG